MAAVLKFEILDIEHITESPLNPRKEFDKERLAELAASVQQKGVLEPILVRPAKDGGFEVAAGARRLRAAAMAGVMQVPAMVREMTDAELLEVAILENVVRHDISPLEEGDAYRALVKDYGYTVEQLVEKTGKSRTVVFQRMKLSELQGSARAALASGKVSASVAELLARLPTEKAQEDALAKLAKEIHYRHQNPDDPSDLSRMPFRDARDLLDEAFRLHLAKAPFDTKAVDLTDAGACGMCPKRTGADKDTFPDVKVDTCLDAVCWQKKTAAATRLLKAEVKEHGRELVKIGRLTDQYDSGKLAGPVREKYSKPGEKVDGKKTWKELLGKDVPVVVALDRENKTHQLVDKKRALELLEAKDKKKAAEVKKALETPTVDSWRERQAEQQAEAQRAAIVRKLVYRRGVEMVGDLDAAVALLLGAMSQETWEWERVLKAAKLEKANLAKLKDEERARLILGVAITHSHYKAQEWLEAALAKSAELDVRKLRKQAAGAAKGTCFVCGCTEAKACDGGCEWTDESQLLCTQCGDGDDE